MNTTSHQREPVELLAEEFLDRFRRGERPSVAEYAGRYPEQAEQIRRLFPALLVLEQVGASGHPGAERSVPAGLTRIGEYRILREVGRGGMGVVFEAVQESLGRHVALKVLPPALCRDKYLERFQREARAAASLHHTNIVPVFGVGADAGMHFYVMQFIDGRGLDSVLHEVRRLRHGSPAQPGDSTVGDHDLSSLARSLLSGSFACSTREPTDKSTEPPATVGPASHVSSSSDHQYYLAVARVGQQVAEALHHAHSQGILHRDVKPSNLLLDSGGIVWITDFGLAKADDAEDLTDTGDLVGTLRYMAPERLQGFCDARSDIHGLGVTLFELFALRPAFDAPGRLRLMEQVAHGTVPRLRQLVPGLPRDLEMVVGKAMAKEPADRYATAQELADDLDRFLSDRPVRARRVPVVERLVRWCRKHPTVAALATIIGVLLAIGSVMFPLAAERLRQEVAAVRAAVRDTQERLWEARLAQAQAGRASRLPGQRFKGLEAIAEAASIRPAPVLRNEAIACMALTDIRVETEWDADLETNKLEFSTGAAFDADLTHFAYTTADGTVLVCATVDGSSSARLAKGVGPADFLKFSPDGRYLAARYNRGTQHPCRIWEWQTGKLIFERMQTAAYLLALDFRADSESLVLADNQALETIALPSGRTLGKTPINIRAGWVAVDPGKGNLVAVGGQMSTKLRVVDLSINQIVAAWDDLPTEPVGVAWHPGARVLAASGRDGNLYTFDLDTRSQSAGNRREDGLFYWLGQNAQSPPPIKLQGHPLEARELTFSPDGALLVSRGWDGTTRFWDPVAGHELLRIRGASFLQFSRDGRRLAYRGYNSRRLGIWELADPVCRVLHSRKGRASQAQTGVSFSPDSRLLATGAADEVALWDPPSGRLLNRVETGPISDLLFDPSGRFLYVAREGTPLALPLARSQDDDGVVWRIGSAQSLLGKTLPLNGYQIHSDRHGDRLALVERFKRVLLISAPSDRWEPRVFLRDHPQVSSAALSPDGRYVATGTWRGEGVKVWDGSTGELIQDLPAKGSAGVGFSPDGSRLLVFEPEVGYRSYQVGAWGLDWEQHDADAGFTRGLRAAFHPNGRIMAQVANRVNLRLVDLENGEELAVLPVPESQNLAGYDFSPDGRYLAAATVQGAVQLWDLRLLRVRLRAAGLDWEPPDAGTDAKQHGATRVESVDATR